MTTHESIEFSKYLANLIENGKAKGVEKGTAKRLAKDSTAAEFLAAYVEARQAQRRSTRAIRLVDYPEGGKGKKVKHLDKKATKARDAAMEERGATQKIFVTVHKAIKRFLQGRLDMDKGVRLIKSALGVKLTTKAFVALTELWTAITGFEPKAVDDEKPAKKREKAEKPAKKRSKKDESDDSSDDESDDEKPAKKRKLAKKAEKKSNKKLARVKPTKKRVVEDDSDDLSSKSDDSSDSDDESDDDSE